MQSPNELEAIVRSGRETKSLDYKAASAWDEGNKRACCALVKDVLALANSGGGHLVIGVSEAPNTFLWEGLSDTQIATFDPTRLNRFVANYADPPINCNVVKVESQGKHFAVIEVPGFSDTPHICQKEFPGELIPTSLYVRTNNNESAPIKSSADFRNIVEIAVRNKQDKLLESFRAILQGSNATDQKQEAINSFKAELERCRKLGAEATAFAPPGLPPYRGYRDVWCYPGRFEPERFDLATLRRISQIAGEEEFRGWPFLFAGHIKNEHPYATENGLDAHYSFEDFLVQQRKEYWHLGQSGLIYKRVLMPEETPSNKGEEGSFMEVRETVCYIAEALKAMCTLYEDVMEPGEATTFGLQFTGCKGRHLVRYSYPLSGNYESSIDIIEYQRTRPLADWRAGLVDHAVAIAMGVFERFNWNDPDRRGALTHVNEMFARRYS